VVTLRGEADHRRVASGQRAIRLVARSAEHESVRVAQRNHAILSVGVVVLHRRFTLNDMGLTEESSPFFVIEQFFLKAVGGPVWRRLAAQLGPDYCCQ
jgi:hypothetical protein